MLEASGEPWQLEGKKALVNVLITLLDCQAVTEALFAWRQKIGF